MTDAASAAQVLLDERAIEQVVIAYAYAIDQCDWDALREVFLPDATADLGTRDTLVGVEVITERIKGTLERLDASHHLIGNHQVRVTGDTATHRCYVQAQHVRRAAEPTRHYIVAGRYEDELVRTPEGWRIAHRRLAIQWREGNPAVLTG